MSLWTGRPGGAGEAPVRHKLRALGGAAAAAPAGGGGTAGTDETCPPVNDLNASREERTTGDCWRGSDNPAPTLRADGPAHRRSKEYHLCGQIDQFFK